tara:strand:+ start:36 stop:332 length:297 start_codon:yes stop_codon:yes gene_type:complete
MVKQSLGTSQLQSARADLHSQQRQSQRRTRGSRQMSYLLPTSWRGRLFAVLTFLNVGLASFFAGISQMQSCIYSSVTAMICLGVWYYELQKNIDEQGD